MTIYRHLVALGEHHFPLDLVPLAAGLLLALVVAGASIAHHLGWVL